MTATQKQKRMLLILSIVVAVLLTAIVLVLVLREEGDPPPEEQKQILVLERNPSDILSISYSYQGKQVQLKQTNGIWALLDESDPDAANFPLNTNFLFSASERSMTAKCAKLVLERRVLDNCTDKAAYGLQTPTISLTYELLANPDSPTTETFFVKVHFGKQYATSQYYCMIEVADVVDPALYLIDSAYFDTFALTKDDLAQRDSLPQIEAELVVSYQLGDTLITDKEQIAAIHEKLKGFDFSDFARYKVTGDGFAEYGLAWQTDSENPNVFTVTPEQVLKIVHYASKADRDKEDDPETEDVDERVTPYTFYLGIGKTEEGKTYYRTYGATAIYQVDADFVTELAAMFAPTQES